MRKDVEAGRPGDRERLEAVLADRNSAQKHAWRARIILAHGRGCGTTEDMVAGVSKLRRRWQRRFRGGVMGAARPGRRSTDAGWCACSRTLVRRGRDDALDQPGMGKVTGLAISTVQKIWRAHGLAPTGCHLQAQPRPAVAAKSMGRPLRRPAGPCGGALGRERAKFRRWIAPSRGPMKKGRAGTLTQRLHPERHRPPCSPRAGRCGAGSRRQRRAAQRLRPVERRRSARAARSRIDIRCRAGTGRTQHQATCPGCGRPYEP